MADSAEHPPLRATDPEGPAERATKRYGWRHTAAAVCGLIILTGCGGPDRASDPDDGGGSGETVVSGDEAPSEFDPDSTAGPATTRSETNQPRTERPVGNSTESVVAVDLHGSGTTTTAPGATGPAAEDLSVSLTPVASLETPIAMAVRPDDPLIYIAERSGRVVALGSDGSTSLQVDITAQVVDTSAERGLLGIAFSADGDELFLSHTDPDGNSRLVGLPVAPAGERLLADPMATADQRQLASVEQPFPNHNGGDVHLGPDGMLWWALGDGGAGGDPLGHGQNADTLLGSILRLDPRTGEAPTDNPFIDGPGADEAWITGVRNPWRISFDEATGDLWIADVGQNAVEEIDLLEAPGLGRGANLGWAVREGDRPFDGADDDGDFVDPIVSLERDPYCSITGGHVYRGEALPGLVGAYVFSDFCSGKLEAVVGAPGDPRVVEIETDSPIGRPIAFGRGPNRELYIMDLEGTVARLDP